MMLKTWLVDGDKGGVGKSLATRALVHYLLTLPQAQRPVIAVFDADMSNPDVCGFGGLSTGNSDLARTGIIDLSLEYGWIQFADALTELGESAADTGNTGVRIVVNMPAQIGPRAFRGDIPLVAEVLREACAVPVWMLSRTDESIRTLGERVTAMPHRFACGLALRNLFFGAPSKFVRWENSALRTRLLGQGWIEDSFPEINDEVISQIGRTPFHVALEQGLDGRPLSHGYRLVLETWLRGTNALFAALDALAFPEQ